ncbi:MAG: hypothetical protein ABI690_29150 [Chloroflexota bacterium]
MTQKAVHLMEQLYPFLHGVHYWLGRIGLLAAVLMFGTGWFIGITRKRDVTSWYRRATYTVAGIMVLESLVGGLMFVFIGVRPAEDVHLVYGLGAILALPFFIFVEVTAKKRPAMGSYIWGFAVLAGILIRALFTGAA